MCSTGGLILSYLGVRPNTILLAESELSPRPKKSSLRGMLDFLFISQNNDSLVSAGIDSTASLQPAACGRRWWREAELCTMCKDPQFPRGEENIRHEILDR
jgi:hypothetical protein